MKLNRFGYLFKEGIKSIFTHGFMSFASVTIIVACLIIMGSFSLLTVNVNEVIRELEQDNQILAFVDETLSAEETKEIQPRLEALPNVAQVQFISRGEAMESFVSGYEDEDESTFSDIDESFFRDRYAITLNDLSLMEATQNEIKQVRGVADVNAHLEISRGFITARNIVSVVSLILIVVLLVVSVFIMANTIKLASFGRKEEIAIMKMVGASNAFIRCPFIIEGLVLGLLGGGIAFFIQWGLYSFVCGKVMGSMLSSFVALVSFASLMWPVLAVFLAIGLVVGVFGSSIAIRNYLNV